MTTVTAAPTHVVGHPELGPATDTDAGRLRSVALARSVVATTLGGWLVQTPHSVATGTPAGTGLVDVAVLDHPTPDAMAEVAALAPGRPHPAVWSARPLPHLGGWEHAPGRVLVSIEARHRPVPDVPSDVEVVRVDDLPGVERLRAAARGVERDEQIGPALLCDERIRAWVARGRGGSALLLAVAVGDLDVVAALAGEPESASALLAAWRQERPDLPGVAVLDAGAVGRLRSRHLVHEVAVHVARRPAPT